MTKQEALRISVSGIKRLTFQNSSGKAVEYEVGKNNIALISKNYNETDSCQYSIHAKPTTKFKIDHLNSSYRIASVSAAIFEIKYYSAEEQAQACKFLADLKG